MEISGRMIGGRNRVVDYDDSIRPNVIKLKKIIQRQFTNCHRVLPFHFLWPSRFGCHGNE